LLTSALAAPIFRGLPGTPRTANRASR
jgi:hypothetical protein